MLTHSRIAELTPQLSGRLARLSQGAGMRLTGTSVGVRAFESPMKPLHPAARQFELRPLTVRRRDVTRRVRCCTRSQSLPLRLPCPEQRPTSQRRGAEGAEEATAGELVIWGAGLEVISSLDPSAGWGVAISADLERAL